MQVRKSNKKAIGSRLRVYRIGAELEVKVVAKKLNVSKQTVYHVEAGRRGMTTDLLMAFAHLYKVESDVIMTGNRA